MRRSGASLAAFAWMGTSAVLFAGMNFLARVASAHEPWPLVGGARAAVGALVAVSVARLRGGSASSRGSPSMWLRTAFGTAAMICTFYALSSKEIPLADAVTLMNLSPVFLAFFAPFVLGERGGRRVVMALPLALAGIVLVVRPTVLFGGVPRPEMLVPAAVSMLGALFSAFAMMMLRRVGESETPEAIAAHFSTVAAVTLFGLSFVVRPSAMPSRTDVAAMVGTGLCAGLAQLAMTRAYTLEVAARVSPFGYLSVVMTALFGAIALHEPPSPMTLAGMTLVVAGGLVIAIAGVRDERRLVRTVSASLTSGTLGEGAARE